VLREFFQKWILDFAEAWIFVMMPLAANLLLATVSFFIHSGDFAQNVSLCWGVAGVAVLTSSTTFLAFLVLNMKPARTLAVLLVQAVALIFVFAAVYRGFGLLYSGTAPGAAQPFTGGRNALYFSIITWTTTGYGDFTPPFEIRPVAALQALTGYIFFGLVVGLATTLLAKNGDNES
jgi:hypothetical protein